MKVTVLWWNMDTNRGKARAEDGSTVWLDEWDLDLRAGFTAGEVVNVQRATRFHEDYFEHEGDNW